MQLKIRENATGLDIFENLYVFLRFSMISHDQQRCYLLNLLPYCATTAFRAICLGNLCIQGASFKASPKTTDQTSTLVYSV